MTDSNQLPPFEETHPVAKRRILRGVAAFEATKGIAALAALIGVLDIMHRDVRHLAIELIGRFGLNPDAHYSSILLHYADLLPGANMPLIVFLACGYVFVRLLEAYGLWNDLAWGEWLAALSGGLYVPFEVGHLMHRPSIISAAVLGVNVFMIIFLAAQLWHRRKNDPKNIA